jgi:hypothetical protein
VRRQDREIILWHYIAKPRLPRLYITVFPHSLHKMIEKALKMG